ncbi:MAG: GIY-YIG nuclease family protein [Ignavibacteriae bacterium]|nr:GIY-YIG nuclease family protein [Ignavibacteriota bacterium]
MKTKKEIRNEYKLMKFRAGIFQIINKKENRIYLKTSSDLDRAFNSDIFQLKAGMHSNKNLQNDWNNLGLENFEFKIFDELDVQDTESPKEINQDLKELLDMHLTELKKNGQLLY